MHIPRLSALLVAAAALVVSTASPAQADSLLFGQTQSYTATMRADKRVVTHAKLIFTNSSDKQQESTSFTIPEGIKASNVAVYQIIPPHKACKSYETLQQWQERTPDTPADLKLQQSYQADKKCLDQASPKEYDLDYNFKSYASTYSYRGMPESSESNNISFEKLTPKQNGNAYTIPLSLPLQPQKDGAILVAYLGEGFVSEFAGNYSYNYKTLQVNDAVENVTVAINLDEDLYSKGTKARTAAPEIATDMASGSSKSSTPMSSNNLTDLQNTIGSGGTITRSSAHLLPGDSFSVSGSFADSPWKLYYGEIGIGLLLFIIGIAIGWFVWHRRRNNPKGPSGTAATSLPHKSEASKSVKAETIHAEPAFNPVRALLAAILGVAGSITASIIMSAVTSTTSRDMYYNAAFPSGLAVLALVYLYFLIVLPLFLTVRHGYKTIFTWATLEVVLLILAVIVAGAIASTTSPTGPTYPY